MELKCGCAGEVEEAAHRNEDHGNDCGTDGEVQRAVYMGEAG